MLTELNWTKLYLLPSCTDVGGYSLRVAGAKGVDVQSTAPRVACIDTQFDGLTLRPNVHVNSLNTLFVKLIVIAKTDDVLQQTRLINLWAFVADAQAGPVGLTCYQSIAFQ